MLAGMRIFLISERSERTPQVGFEISDFANAFRFRALVKSGSGFSLAMESWKSGSPRRGRSLYGPQPYQTVACTEAAGPELGRNWVC
jgi:hypothetical protein